MDYPGNKSAVTAQPLEDKIIGTNRRGGARDDGNYLFFLEGKQLFQYYSILGKRGIRAANTYVSHCLGRRKIENPRPPKRTITTPPPKDTLSSVLHRLVDVIVEEDRFGFLAEEDIDHAISVIKTLSNSRMTYEQAASEIGCSVQALHTRVCRERIKTEHTVYLRRNDVERLKR